MTKSPDAFRTISEVAKELGLDAHVLRFWESKFKQIQPIKNASGRRLYRPEDVALIGGIQNLLHHRGMTIKGVQKILREKGARAVLRGDVSGLELVTATPEEGGTKPDLRSLKDIRDNLHKALALLQDSK